MIKYFKVCYNVNINKKYFTIDNYYKGLSQKNPRAVETKAGAVTPFGDLLPVGIYFMTSMIVKDGFPL